MVLPIDIITVEALVLEYLSCIYIASLVGVVRWGRGVGWDIEKPTSGSICSVLKTGAQPFNQSHLTVFLCNIYFVAILW